MGILTEIECLFVNNACVACLPNWCWLAFGIIGMAIGLSRLVHLPNLVRRTPVTDPSEAPGERDKGRDGPAHGLARSHAWLLSHLGD